MLRNFIQFLIAASLFGTGGYLIFYYADIFIFEHGNILFGLTLILISILLFANIDNDSYNVDFYVSSDGGDSGGGDGGGS